MNCRPGECKNFLSFEAEIVVQVSGKPLVPPPEISRPG